MPSYRYLNEKFLSTSVNFVAGLLISKAPQALVVMPAMACI